MLININEERSDILATPLINDIRFIVNWNVIIYVDIFK